MADLDEQFCIPTWVPDPVFWEEISGAREIRGFFNFLWTERFFEVAVVH